MPARIRFVPVHLAARPCRTLARSGGGAFTWQASAVTCDECRPAATWLTLLADFAGELLAFAVLAVAVFLSCCLG